MARSNLRLVHSVDILAEEAAAAAKEAEEASGETGAAAAPANFRRPALLGEILVERGALSPQDLARAVALQAREEARFGDILLANGMVTQQELYEALAFQYDTMVADLGPSRRMCA